MARSFLENNPFFTGLKPEYLELISQYAHTDTFKPGECIVEEGGAADKFYVISSGKVNLEIQMPGSHPFAIQALERGDIIGWSWLIAPHQWRFTVRAVEKTELVVINGQVIQKACEDNHDLGYELFRQMTGILVKRLDAIRYQLLQMYNQGIST
ncbi:MAG: cyclic nucleotide-binding domain-containing protein [Candidatus Omnitrophota bacterium]|nr:cyclic nucleotide-binding domain-containing protein [Candidatus Omnitrophota bacterium]MDZ4242839.1 cyclic nucleotide-binding domain-containing protein [Candidatus Omnitrophota bacterium]